MRNRYPTSDTKSKSREIRPLDEAAPTVKALRILEARGVLSLATAPAGSLTPLAVRPGALERFLRSRG